MGKKDGKSQKTAARAAQWGEAAPMCYRGGAEMVSMRLMGLMGLMRPMGCDKRVWAMRGRQRREQRREQRGGGEAVLFPGVL